MIKIIDIPKIKIASINNKYVFNPRIHRLILSPQYRAFKNAVDACCLKHIKSDRKIKVFITISCYADIDNCIKAVLDVVNDNVCNDRHIDELHVFKTAIKRGLEGSLRVEIEEIYPARSLKD